MPTRIDLTGQRFGRFVAIEPSTTRQRLHWIAVCDCGEVRTVSAYHLRSGASQSCGCRARELTANRSWKHGHDRRRKRTSEYNTWAGMRSRCLRPSDKLYPYYGGRGIVICDRWRDLEHGFENFFADMGPRPSRTHSIERVDNNKGYFPENCVWGTKREQMRNTRYSRRVTYQGREMCLKEATELAGLNYKTVHNRINKHGWSVERALSTAKQ